jgi:ATP-dependent RNA helicase DHX37/DHR1
VPHKKDHSPKSSPASEDPENDSIRHGLIFNMPPKFVPRQRKHKVLARQKHHNGPSEEQNDSNAVEHIPAAKAQLEEKKQRMKEELKKHGVKVSGKKAKRLEKYIETKLKKDENRELIAQLANSKIDTTLYQSSRKLGQGRETKRERLSRALKDSRAGIDIDGDNEDILFEKRVVKEVADEVSDNESQPDGRGLFQTQPKTAQIIATPVSLGAGLKRPLDVDEEGNPVLKKRKRRGGVKSKVSFKHEVPEAPEEPEWEGFGSTSEMDSNADEDVSIHGYDDISDASDNVDEEGSSSSEEESEQSQNSDEETGDKDSSSESDEEETSSPKPQRSSAFKAWANQQLNEALGYQPVSNVPNATETPKIEGFVPRAPELDPLPAELQPTPDSTRKAFSVAVERPTAIQDVRLKLPVVAEEQKIMEAVHNNNLVVVYGATGSGKTTQVPQFLYEAGYGTAGSPNPGIIGVTQPRRVAAVSMAKRVGDELGDHGKRVAYQIRFEGTVSAQTAIKFMTDGVLLREVAQDIALRKYSAIVIDEAHERSVNTDILIGMLSRVVKLREEMAEEDPLVKPLKLIIMSATLRISDFTQNETLFSKPPPVLQAEGRQYPVTNHFARKTHHDYVEEAFRKVSKGHKKLPPGGFLVFLTGQNEITHLSKKLKEAFRIGHSTSGPQVRISGKDAPLEAEDVDFGEILDDGNDDYDDGDDGEVDISLEDNEFDVEEEAETGPAKMHVLPLYSLLPTREQLRVFEAPPDGSRLVILATNVAETSLTIPGIRYVFDCGRSKERKYDRTTGVQSFEVGWISKASASQRAGRAGRTGPGHCYRLYSSAVYERDFEEFAEPEILRMPIEGVVLQLKAMNLQHVVNFPFPTPPDRQSLASSEKLLTYLSAISCTGQITPTGSTMSIFPLSPRFARILLVGHLHDCLPYTIALVAGLSAADIFIPENQAIPALAPREEDTYLTTAEKLEEDARANIKRQFNKVQKDFCFLDDKSDAIKLLQVVGEFAHEPTESWCQSHFVRFKVLKEISQLRRQITDLLRTNITAFAALKYEDKLDPPSAKQVKALKQMVAAGFIDHIAIRADMSPNPPDVRRKPTRAIDVPYFTLFPSHLQGGEAEKAVYMHPSSPLAHISPQECPEYIVYSYLQKPAPSPATPNKIPRTRMHSLTDITGGQLAALAKGTPLISYGKPIKEVMPKTKSEGLANERECWVIPYLRVEGSGGIGWPLPARKVTQKKIPGRGWVVE